LDAQIFLQPHTVPPRAHTPSQVLKDPFFGLSSHLTENSFGYWRSFSAIYYKCT